ncbi:hypothetical protein BDV26DRAFT_292672 [Aspergillus bertholletiae]|uniref:NAD(P)-binding protein n=1 Tax=Aspergillus bertholletiae TaxID=1226010 RepID=A0A5N7B869_9EURO|nr:hypothetical protein BDV26DRAFT_292672 [Aspergillus bertholletiae]
MASASVVSISPNIIGEFSMPHISPEAIATLNQLLQENHDRYHPFFNDKGFHNHIVHYLLSAVSLGATSENLSRAFTQERAIQRPQLPLNEDNLTRLADTNFFQSCLGREEFYRDFLIFFQHQISIYGYGPVVNRYVFSRTDLAEQMFTRLWASFLHPLIHLGYGIEFDQPAIVAEALAQIAVHQNEVATAMLGAEKASATSRGQKDTSMLHLLQQVREDDRIRNAACWGDGSWIEDLPLTAAPEELWELAGQWRVDASHLVERTAEMINTNGFFCGAAQAPPKEYKLDFFFIHNLNCSIFFPAFWRQDWLSLDNKVRLLEWKGRFDIISYAARGSPLLDAAEILDYHPKRPGTGWEELFQRVNVFDDDSHVTKFLRGLAHGSLYCQSYDHPDCFPMTTEMWLQVGHMAMDSTEKEPIPKNRWGASVARRFAKAYPIVLLARNPANYQGVADEINSGGGRAIGISTDLSDSQSVKNAFDNIRSQFGAMSLAAAVFNLGGGFVKRPFLELSEDEFETGFAVQGKGAFNFAQATLPMFLKATDLQHPPTLIFTGATASLKGGASLATFAAGKFALRALSQSLAREFGPQGIHVSHVIIDGIINTPRTKEFDFAKPDAKLNPDAIADTYWYLHQQPRTGFTHELDLRPYVEAW